MSSIPSAYSWCACTTTPERSTCCAEPVNSPRTMRATPMSNAVALNSTGASGRNDGPGPSTSVASNGPGRVEMALVSIARDTGVFARALRHARELAALDPADSAARPGLGSRVKGSSVAAFSGVATSSSAWPPEVGQRRYPLIGIVIEGALWPKLDCQGTSHPQIGFR